MPFVLPPPRFRKRRHVALRPWSPPAPPGPLTLVAAVYEKGVRVTLTFGRAVNIAALDVTAIRVNDATSPPGLYQGAGAGQLLNPTTLRVALTILTPFAQPGVFLNATAANGVVAAGDGAAWAGASGVALPFP